MTANHSARQPASRRFTWVAFVLVVLVLFTGACAPVPGAPPAGGAVVEQPAASAPELQPEPLEAVPLPPPKTCDPGNPILNPVEIIVGPEQSKYGEGIYTLQAAYFNPEMGQQFVFEISSQRPEELLAFAQSLQVCFEVLETQETGQSEGSDGSEEEDIANTVVFLMENPFNIVFEFMVAQANVNPEVVVAVHFVVDPILDNDRTDDFMARCTTGKWIGVRITGVGGFATGHLYVRDGPVPFDSTTQAVPGAPSDEASHNNRGRNTTYDARVTGGRGTEYRLSGTWQKYGSSISTNAC